MSCVTSQGAVRITAYAYRPSEGYASAAVYTGPPNTGLDSGAVIPLVSAETDKPGYTVDEGCSRTL